MTPRGFHQPPLTNICSHSVDQGQNTSLAATLLEAASGETMSGYTVSKDLSGLVIPDMPLTLPVEFEEAVSCGLATFILICLSEGDSCLCPHCVLLQLLCPLASCITVLITDGPSRLSSPPASRFFTELEARHQNNIFIEDISDIVEKHTTSTFDPYVKYCTNEVYQQRTLQKLLATNPSFKEVLSRIESHEDCRNLPMISFLILPMQRVTRLPLLMDTICQKTPKDSPKYEVCKRALKEVSKLVRLCNEGARKMERTEMMYTINSQLEFKIKPFPLVSSSRWLVKRGELTAYVEDTVLFSKRTSKQQVYFFLFNDVLIITKKKSEESYNVNDYSLRDQLLVESCDSEELNSSPGKNSSTMLYSRQNSASHLFTLTVLSNHANEKVEMLLGAETQSERARWITALGHSSGKQPPDRTSLTQVEIIRSFTAKQPDELSLQVADVVLIYQRVSDGWYEGERLRDGERGWFPMECAKEITCQATIDKNVERMGRLLGLETNV
nr:PREDICTED: rho guanine nucleotide exchange factor 26 [Bos mutus]